MKLAEALLRRKELGQRLANIKPLMSNIDKLFKTHVKRVSVSDGIDEATISAPKLTLGQVTQEHDFYAKRLRLVDAAIQQANWTAEVEAVFSGCDVNEDYVPPNTDE